MSGTRVDIVDATTGEVIDHCYGPTLAGLCPRLDEQGIAPCNGHRIVPLGAGPESWLHWVPTTSRHCPMAWNHPLACNQAEYV